MLRKVKASDAIAGRFYEMMGQVVLCVRSTDKLSSLSLWVDDSSGPDVFGKSNGRIQQVANSVEMIELPSGYTWGDSVAVESSTLPIIPKENACEDCKHWKQIAMDDVGRNAMRNPKQDIGRCMHHPVITGKDGNFASFPIVKNDDRCSMFEQNPKLT